MINPVRAVLAMALAVFAAAAQGAYSCSVSTSGSINFLTYDPAGAAPTANATVTLTCNHLGGGNEFVNWTMTLSNGAAGTCVSRIMQRQTSPADTLDYNIFQNSTTAVWGNATCGTFPSGQLQLNNGNPVRSTVQTMSGVLPAGQSAPVGNYSDTLVLTVTF